MCLLPGTSGTVVGRQTVCFSESTEMTKRRKTSALRKHCETEELVYAAQMSLRASGQAEAAKLLREASASTPTRSHKIRKVWETQTRAPMILHSTD
jgi:hypothetical protein